MILKAALLKFQVKINLIDKLHSNRFNSFYECFVPFELQTSEKLEYFYVYKNVFNVVNTHTYYTRGLIEFQFYYQFVEIVIT